MEKQKFEEYPELVKHIQRMGETGTTGTLSQWNLFIACLNKSLRVATNSGYGEGQKDLRDGENSWFNQRED